MWWKLGGGLLLAAALAGLVWLYGGAQYRSGKADGTSAERTLWQDKVVEAERGKLDAFRAGVASVDLADGRYIETVRDRIVPLTRTIVERSSEYAATPAGAAICLAPDRVQWLEQTRSALFTPSAPGPASSVAGTVPADAEDDEYRRDYE